MAFSTKIQWCDHTWNPWRGCEHDSPGCDNCYAEFLALRNPAVLGEWGPDGRRAIAAEDYWQLPLKWDRAACAAGERRRVFFSLGDPFEDNPQLVAARDRMFSVIQATPRLDYLLLTKRPQHVARLSSVALGWDVAKHGFPPNVWLGTSVESHGYLSRIAELMELKCTLRFLSLEPLLADLGTIVKPIGCLDRFLHHERGRPCEVEVYPFLGMKAIPDHDWDTGKIHWVIVGGESGPGARPCNVEWIRRIVAICQRASVPVFVKQLGARAVMTLEEESKGSLSTGWLEVLQVVKQLAHEHPKGGDPAEWPEDLRVREFPTIHRNLSYAEERP